MDFLKSILSIAITTLILYAFLLFTASEIRPSDMNFEDGWPKVIQDTGFCVYVMNEPGGEIKCLQTTDKIVFEFDAESIPGCRLSITAVMGEVALPHGATTIVDDSEAE